MSTVTPPEEHDVHDRPDTSAQQRARPPGPGAREMQERRRPAEVILQGSRAIGDHRHDSGVALMPVCPDLAAV